MLLVELSGSTASPKNSSNLLRKARFRCLAQIGTPSKRILVEFDWNTSQTLFWSHSLSSYVVVVAKRTILTKTFPFKFANPTGNDMLRTVTIVEFKIVCRKWDTHFRRETKSFVQKGNAGLKTKFRSKIQIVGDKSNFLNENWNFGQ